MKVFTKSVLFAGLSLFSFAAVAQGSPIKVAVDFSDVSQANHTASDARDVVIDSIIIDRTQPAASGAQIDISPKYANKQIGWVVSYKGNKKDIILDNMDIERFVRDAVTLGFERSGYRVVSTDKDGGDAIYVDVRVNELWMWKESIDGRRRYNFYFSMDTELTSNTEGVADIGSIRVTDFRRGSQATRWKSYRNTILHSMKAYVANFADGIKKMEARTGVPAEGLILQETLSRLDKLLESGVISPAEYKELRLRAIEADL